MSDPLQPSRVERWRLPFDIGARRPVLGAVIGLLLVVLLVPVLGFWHGAEGPLGPSIPLFFLIPVILASAMGDQRVGVLVSFVAIAVWDWYFIVPFYTVTIYYPRDVLALVVFLAVALVVGQLSKTVRQSAEEAIRRARSSEALYDLSMALIAHHDQDDVLPDLTQRLCWTFNLEACAVVLSGDSGKSWRTAAAAGALPDALRVESNRDVAAMASWVNTQGQASWLGEARHVGVTANRARVLRGRWPGERVRFLPLRVGANGVGVLELVDKSGAAPDPERERLLATFANGAAIALEQARLAKEQHDAEVARESDRLKTALLSSVSHDLRTPLAGIKAAASSLLQDDVQWSDEDRRAFAADINTEADRLTRLVSNLLDLSRIEAGALTPQLEWEDVGELIARVVRRLASQLSGHEIVQAIASDLPAVRLDAVQVEQVLVNLLENAAKYSPPGAAIGVAAHVAHEPAAMRAIAITVSDDGIGISRAEQGRIFDKFYRVVGSASRVSGTGMGLAIVKGLVDAHGGRISVESSPGHGSAFTVVLPIDPQMRTSAPAKPSGVARSLP